MSEESKHNKTKWPKICWDLWMTITVFILMSSYHIAKPMLWYRFGLTLELSWHGLLYATMLLPLLSIGLMLILIIRLIFLTIRFGIKQFLLQVAFVIAAIGVFFMPPIFNCRGKEDQQF